MKKDYIEIILTTFAVVAALFAIFLAVWKLAGSSPSIGEINAGFIILIASWLIILTYKFGRFEGMAKSGFHYARKDMMEVKEELKGIKAILLERRR